MFAQTDRLFFRCKYLPKIANTLLLTITQFFYVIMRFVQYSGEGELREQRRGVNDKISMCVVGHVGWVHGV